MNNHAYAYTYFQASVFYGKGIIVNTGSLVNSFGFVAHDTRRLSVFKK